MTEETGIPAVAQSHPVTMGFRLLLSAGALGMAAGGVILIGEGLFHIVDSVISHLRHTATTGVSGQIMKATDELLFGIVLTIFSANIAFGFCMDEARTAAYRIPSFMSAKTIPELKSTFCQVIIVYLIVDFATDIIADADKLDIKLLYFPTAIVLISAALRLMSHTEYPAHPSQQPHDPS